MESPFRPPTFFVDSSSPASTENTRRVVDITPLKKKKGLETLTLPSTSSSSIYLATANVPPQWEKEMMDALFFAGGGTDSPIMKRFCVCAGVDWRSLHILLHLVRSRKTSECYLTQGALNLIDESLKPGENCKWLIRGHYRSLLHTVAQCTKDDVQDLINFDLSLRYKRSKRDPSVTTTTEDGLSFAFVSYINDHGQSEWCWVDITLSNDKPQKTPLQSRPTYTGPSCHAKDCHVAINLSQCGRCKSVFYCSKEHQSSDWPTHKLVCCSPK